MLPSRLTSFSRAPGSNPIIHARALEAADIKSRTAVTWADEFHDQDGAADDQVSKEQGQTLTLHPAGVPMPKVGQKRNIVKGKGESSGGASGVDVLDTMTTDTNRTAPKLLYLFSGPQRKGQDIDQCCTNLGWSLAAFDVKRSPDHDLLDDHFWETILMGLKKGVYSAALFPSPLQHF